MTGSAEQRREALVDLYREVHHCHECPLADTRTQAVFGAGNANADLLFVGEAPGAEEDRQGLPFVGRAGKLLNQLIGEIGMGRQDVFITNVLKCLRYNALVQLGDGSWERIGRLIHMRYGGEVMSVDEHGSLVPRRVVGWHATPLGGRSVYRLTYAGAKATGAHTVSTQLTGDHPVLTTRGFVPVAELTPDDLIATGHGLTDVEFDLISGTLLGDGTLSPASSHLAFTHSQHQLSYALFKANVLAALQPRYGLLNVAAVAGGERLYHAVQVRTLAHRSLRLLRQEWYCERKIVPRWLATGLTPRMLAIWFIDDGHLRVRPPRRPAAEIATDGFGRSDLDVLLHGLANLGLPAIATHRGRLAFGVDATEDLTRVIGRFVPEPMRWKLAPHIEQSVPFDPTSWAPGPRRVMFDRVVAEDVTDRPRADTTFFCIDVESTHNFVTSGGVVHNCRPPGNRDPQPEEIEACWPYLERQIELIEPRVIATLGNFATKRITGSPTGITRCCGIPQRHELGRRNVWIYPLFHPAAALRTPSVLERLRQDFARIPELLAQPLPELEPPPAREQIRQRDPESQLDLFA